MNRRLKVSWLFPFVLLTLLATTSAVALLLLDGTMVSPLAEGSLLSNVFFFLLINFNIVVIMVLAFLVCRNLVKLILDRQRGILGSRLRSRLVAAFVGLAIVPSVVLFFIAKGILGSVIQGWFSPQISSSVDGALALARQQYDASENQLARGLDSAAGSISRVLQYSRSRERENVRQTYTKEYLAPMSEMLDAIRSELGLCQLAIVTGRGEKLYFKQDSEPISSGVDIPDVHLTSVVKALRGELVIRPEHSLNGEFLRAYAPIVEASPWETPDKPGIDVPPSVIGMPAEMVLVGTVWIRPELNLILSQVINAYDDYKELRTYRRPLASTYLLTLVGVTLLIVFAAVWVGFYLARSLSEPIKYLAIGTQEVARGNLNHRIPEIGDDEMSILVRSFNKMTSDLSNTTAELLKRKRHMETVLESVSVGVISINASRQVDTINSAAARILGLATGSIEEPVALDVIFTAEVQQVAEQLLNSLDGGKTSAIFHTSLTLGGTAKHVQFGATILVDDVGNRLGSVLLVDDLTELVRAQRMTAWRDVARRIAHEIKNPLTPIQLNAQRLQKRFEKKKVASNGDGADRQLVISSSQGIVEQVQALRGLVDEFSRFARMPKIHLELVQVNQLIGAVIEMYQSAHSEIEFSFSADNALPELAIDREQIRRCLVNLLDNAVSSVKEKSPEEPLVEAATEYESSLGILTIRITDNGIGIPDSYKSRVFEPHFSRKREGTGLGLAIVSSIVADHDGYVRIRDNEPSGVSFSIELPVRVSEVAPIRNP